MDSAMVLLYEHILTQNKNNTDIISLNAVIEITVGTSKTILTILYGRLCVYT